MDGIILGRDADVLITRLSPSSAPTYSTYFALQSLSLCDASLLRCHVADIASQNKHSLSHPVAPSPAARTTHRLWRRSHQLLLTHVLAVATPRHLSGPEPVVNAARRREGAALVSGRSA
ncbi:uncharacterized protein TRAVEDRAFT_41527 [Trametes versicolor FP-101664 SS1]|uniref:uncharacterized protein n=1 Tax=Trametes versicolor (strain FP-101664) TaxID=717944 RepID=UPI00046247FF|nr:uncharacterized protein TRAVEDRAFT_41527 [Trametes versicolor FP-101664 SS1]EIW64112.1 hypothetical protein TRAVEDRAFT_41527 [Trametes versicolor FP-101664 SS1]